MIDLNTESIHRICLNYAAAHPYVAAFESGYNFDQSTLVNDQRYPLLFLKLPILSSLDATEPARMVYRNMTFQLQVYDRTSENLLRADVSNLRVHDKVREVLEGFAATFISREAWSQGVWLVSSQVDVHTEVSNADIAIAGDMLITVRCQVPNIRCQLPPDMPSIDILNEC